MVCALVRDWSRQVRVLRDELNHLLATGDRSDPVDETVLSMVEAALHAATAAGLVRCGASDARAAMRAMLAAARAAVVTASFALAESPVPGGSGPAAVRQLAGDRPDRAGAAHTVGAHE